MIDIRDKNGEDHLSLATDEQIRAECRRRNIPVLDKDPRSIRPVPEIINTLYEIERRGKYGRHFVRDVASIFGRTLP